MGEELFFLCDLIRERKKKKSGGTERNPEPQHVFPNRSISDFASTLTQVPRGECVEITVNVPTFLEDFFMHKDRASILKKKKKQPTSCVDS
jgi:hypothetical protein